MRLHSSPLYRISSHQAFSTHHILLHHDTATRSLQAEEDSMPVGGSTVSQLQSQEQAGLLDAIDQLRHENMDAEIGIPRIVVCGDQSSGESSLLEAIAKIAVRDRRHWSRRKGSTLKRRTLLLRRNSTTHPVPHNPEAEMSNLHHYENLPFVLCLGVPSQTGLRIFRSSEGSNTRLMRWMRCYRTSSIGSRTHDPTIRRRARRGGWKN